jgi:hypothetical protein
MISNLSFFVVSVTNLFFPTGTFNATLKFLVKDCDPATGLPDSDEGYDDEYMVSCIVGGLW